MPKKSQYVVGVDIGGHSIKAGRVLKGKIIKFAEVPTEAKKGQKAVLENISQAIEEVITKETAAIGIGCPGGPIDFEKGIIYNAVNLPFRNLNLAKYFSKRFYVPVKVDNDANVFALGEALYGAGKGYRSVIGITLGTGCGGGIVIDRKIEHGMGNAGEMGHMKIDYNGRPCHCGRKGCLEAYVSADGIAETAKKFSLSVGSPEEMYEIARYGNNKQREAALKAWEKTGEYLGIGIVNALNLLDPDVVVIGGGIAKSWYFFSRKTKEYIKKESFSGSSLKIEKAALEHPGIVGASCLFLK